MSREQIRDHIWDFDYEGESNVIDVLVKTYERNYKIQRLFRLREGWDMFSKQTKEVKLPSIASRVTLWYTVFIALIF